MRAVVMKASRVGGTLTASSGLMYPRCAVVRAFRSVGIGTDTAANSGFRPSSDPTVGDNNDVPPSFCPPLHRIGPPPYDGRHCSGNDGGSETAVGDPFERTTLGRGASPPVKRRQSPRNTPASLPFASFVRYDHTADDSNHDGDRSGNRSRSYPVQRCRSYSVSCRTERAPQAAILVLGSVALTAKAGQYAVQAYQQYKQSQPEPPTDDEQQQQQQQQQQEKEQQQDASNTHKTSDKKNNHDTKKPKASRENIFQKYFNFGVGSKYYDGGFEDKMTRREAALILGVRESSTHKRIKEAHRKLLILNHPDTGGSTYLAGKLNEAKDLLLKGRRAERK